MTKKTIVVDMNKNEVGNVAEYLNQQLQSCTDDYLFFFFEDIYSKIIDVEEFEKRYIDFMETYGQPFAFYPYYLHFNKVLTGHISLCNPKVSIYIDNKPCFDVVDDLVYGSLFINVKKFKENGIRFNEDYPMVFFLQDMVKDCFEKKMCLSRIYFMDVLESYKLLSDGTRTGFDFDKGKFAEERKRYMENNKIEGENINFFIATLRSAFKPETKDVSTEGEKK